MRKTLITTTAGALLVLGLTACGGGEDTAFREGFEAAQRSAAAAPASTAPAASSAPAAPAQQLEVPDLDGKNGAVALDELRRLGFTNVEPATQDENDRVVLNPANWTVTGVEPGAGQTVASDSTVVVTMTKK